MEVHVSSLKAEINKYNRLAEEYNACMLNLYNTLGQTSSYWHDTNSGAFIDEVWAQKNQATRATEGMNSLKEVYSMIASRYGALGNDIKFELSQRESVKANFTNYINSLQAVIDAYNSLNLGFGPPEAGAIQSQKSRIQGAKTSAESLKAKVDKVFNDIEQIETDVSSKIGSINISIIKGNNLSKFL